MRRFALLAGLAGVTCVAGCTVGPNYRPPELATPAAFTHAPVAATTSAPADMAQWWTTFNDPELNRLVAIALAENLDIQTAASRIREARYGTIAARSALFPTADAIGQAQRVDFSKNAGLSSLESLFGGGGSTTGGGTGGGSTQPSGIAVPGSGITTYATGFDASWEVDLFGGVRRQVQSARAQTEAAEWNARDAATTLLAEVASDYVQLRVLQSREAITRDEIARQRRSLQIIGETSHAGLVPQGDYIRQRTPLSTVEASLDALDAEENVEIHALALLLGRPPETMFAELSVVRPMPQMPAAVPAGLPSELLRRRPDIRAAERRLAAATADIGVAVADLYPKISLNGMAELLSTGLSNLFTANSVQLLGTAQVSFPVLDFGKRRATVGMRREEAEQAYLAYQKTVLGAFRDVEDALVRLSSEQQRNQTLRKGVDDAVRSTATIDARYRTGLVDLSAVLTSQQSVLQAQDALASSDGALRTDLASLYKALGGGWDSVPTATTLDRKRPYIDDGSK